jgi:hypothetical protein
MEPSPAETPRDQFDGPFKEILEGQLSQFIAFFVPDAWKDIDWDQKPVSLNTELRRSRRNAAVVKLKDYRKRWTELEQSSNIFAVVVIAYLKTRDTRRDPDERLRWKRRLVQLLYQRSYSREEVVALFRLIDGMLHLPEKQAIIFEADLESLEAEYHMPYLSSIERRALQKGIEQGLEQGRDQGRLQQLRKLLEHRFGPLPEWTLERLGNATSSLLDDWAVRLLDASKVEDVFAEPARS